MSIQSMMRATEIGQTLQARHSDAQTVYVPNTDYCFIVLENSNTIEEVKSILKSGAYTNLRIRKSNFTDVVFIIVDLN